MPANAVKPGQEAAWEKAKEQAAAQGHKDDWAYTMAIFKKMVGKEAATGRVADRFLAAYEETGRDSTNGWEHGRVEPIQRTDGEGSQVPFARDNQGQPLDPPDLGTIEIPGYEWHDKSKAFHAIGGKTAASTLRSPSSPRDAEPLTGREEQEVWDAGYEAGSYFNPRAKTTPRTLDAESIFLWGLKDRRLPRGLNESHPQFWEYNWTFLEGLAAYATAYDLPVQGLPRGITAGQDKSASDRAASLQIELKWAADAVDRANELLREVADTLDARRHGEESISDVVGAAAEVSRTLRAEVSPQLAALARTLRH